jgi:hypothetical protein
MKRIALLCVAAAALLIGTALAEPQAEEKPPKGKPDAKKPEAEKPKGEKPAAKKEEHLPGPFKFPPKITLTAQQQSSIAALAKQYGPRLKQIEEAAEGLLTKEQEAARKAAREKAHAEGKRGPEANELVDKAAKLSPEQKARLADVDAQKHKLNDEIHEQLAKLLTAEQKEQLGGRYKEKETKGPPAGEKKGKGKEEPAKVIENKKPN